MQGESYDVHADLLRSILMLILILITTLKTMVISVMELIL